MNFIDSRTSRILTFNLMKPFLIRENENHLSTLCFCRRQTNDMVVAAVNLLNAHTQDFDPVKVSIFVAIVTLNQ